MLERGSCRTGRPAGLSVLQRPPPTGGACQRSRGAQRGSRPRRFRWGCSSEACATQAGPPVYRPVGCCRPTAGHARVAVAPSAASTSPLWVGMQERGSRRTGRVAGLPALQRPPPTDGACARSRGAQCASQPRRFRWARSSGTCAAKAISQASAPRCAALFPGSFSLPRGQDFYLYPAAMSAGDS